VLIGWHTAARGELRELFALAYDSREQIDRDLPLGRVLVASDEASIVGHAQIVECDTADELELRSLAVAKRCPRRGIGRALVEHAIAACRADGARTLVVATATADMETCASTS
jgi:N-acetylglutamate synthase-like GNAT family acetyltransferase